MRESPRLRRLRSDHRAMEELRAQSSILDYSAPGPLFGGLPDTYLVVFQGPGLWRPEGSSQVLLRDRHAVLIRLTAAYPRMMPELIWRTPVFHPNISANGVVCLGGYSSHWVPSLQLDELCTMLWDIVRYQNYDVDSPYNREAARWVRDQEAYAFPLDARPLRDIGPPSTPAEVQPAVWHDAPGSYSARYEVRHGVATAASREAVLAELMFLDDTVEIIDAEIVVEEPPARSIPEILFLD
jgi:hypothetical protein